MIRDDDKTRLRKALDAELARRLMRVGEPRHRLVQRLQMIADLYEWILVLTKASIADGESVADARAHRDEAAVRILTELKKETP